MASGSSWTWSTDAATTSSAQPVDVAGGDLLDDRRLVGEVLVERARADAGAVRDAVSGQPVVAVVDQDVACRVDDLVDHVARSLPARLLPQGHDANFMRVVTRVTLPS
jgi:hypothetical protein